jgi:regulator of protease activity HflC (stomatin/prohibitin superfamily)
LQYVDFFLMMTLMTIVFFTLMFVCSGIKVLKEWERVAILRLGKFYGIRGPGIIWKTPILDHIALKVSLRVQTTDIDMDVRSAESTRRWKGIVNWRIIDVEKYLFGLQDHERTVHTTIQHLVGKEIEFLSNDALFTDTNEITMRIESALGPTSEGWGLKIEKVELRNALDFE